MGSKGRTGIFGRDNRFFPSGIRIEVFWRGAELLPRHKAPAANSANASSAPAIRSRAVIMFSRRATPFALLAILVFSPQSQFVGSKRLPNIAKAARTAKLRLCTGKNQPPTFGIPASRSYRRVQLPVNGNEVTTLPLPSTNVAVPSIDSSFREGLKVIGPT